MKKKLLALLMLGLVSTGLVAQADGETLTMMCNGTEEDA